jgi:hypothetical protein
MRYVTITFHISPDLKEALPIPGGYEAMTWLYTYQAHNMKGNAGFVLAKMDGDISKPICLAVI